MSKLVIAREIYFKMDIFFHGAKTSTGPGPSRCWGFKITLRESKLGMTPLEEWSALRRDLYLKKHNTFKREASCVRRDSEPQSQHASNRRPTP